MSVIAVLLGGLLLAPGAARAEPGALTQSPGLEGCISDDGGGPCTDATELDAPFGITVGPGGRHVYVGLAKAYNGGLAVLSRNRTTGALTQLPGQDGCITVTGSNMQCVQGRAVATIRSTAISPDGKHAYVGAQGSDAVSAFARNEMTGALTQLPGLDGCTSQDGTGGLCVDGRGLGDAQSIAASRDGKHVYAASGTSGAVVAFSRNKATGALTQLPGLQGCISYTGGECTAGRGLRFAGSVAVSDDGRHVYVASLSHAVAAFSRDKATGALTQLPGLAGCIREAVVNSDGQCTDGRGLGYASALTLSEDGKFVYVAGGEQVALFKRDKTTGELTQLPGLAGCVSDSGDLGACTNGKALRGANGVVISPNGKQVYVVSIIDNAVAVFARDKTTGELTQLPGQEGCIAQGGYDGICTEGRGLDYAITLAMSPDGKHVYAGGLHSKAVAALRPER